MICPLCGNKGNSPGADHCSWCQFDLSAVDRPTASDTVEHSLMNDPISLLMPREPVAVSDASSLGDAMKIMIDKHVGAVLVINADNHLVGILTERDFLTKIAGSDNFAALPVADFMTKSPETVTETDPLAFALGKMASGGYRHLPVVGDGGKPIGVISVRDFLRHITSLCQE